MAAGYDPGPPPQLVQPAANISSGWLVGNGSIFSTAADLSRWLDIASAGRYVNFRTLAYPNGWSKRTEGASTILGQDGRIPGYAADISIDETSGQKVVVLSNVQCACVSSMAADIRKAANGGEIVPPQIWPSYNPTPAELNADVGEFALPGLPLLIARSANGLTISNMNDGMQLRLDPVGPQKFFFRALYAYVSFKANEKGAVTSIDWNGQFAIPRVSSPGGT